jgi:thiol-disulfide isomerase/thioredoxin
MRLPTSRTTCFLLFLVAGLWVPFLLAENDAEEHLVLMDDGTEIPVHVRPSAAGPVVLWLPSEHGLLPGHHQQARQLHAVGIETWLPDPFTGYFLPNAPSSFDRIPATLVATLIQEASRGGDRPVFVFGNDRVAPWLLEGLRQWQLDHPGADHLAGLVLMSPYLHTGLPEVGQTAEFHPIARATNLPIYLIQPTLSPQYPLVRTVRSLLAEGGSDVAVRILPEVRDRFFFRPNTLPAEEDLKPRFTGELLRAMQLLARVPATRSPAPVAGDQLRLATPTRQDRRLEPVHARPEAPPLRLPSLEADLYDLSDYRGEVVLINFWASWCPPCVHEMPSMQRLEDRLRDQGFRILAVNLGESEETVRAFLQLIGTGFTILLDPHKGSLSDWRAMAYPSSYVVDRAGRLRYSLFGAIEWNEPDVIAQISALLEE